MIAPIMELHELQMYYQRLAFWSDP